MVVVVVVFPCNIDILLSVPLFVVRVVDVSAVVVVVVVVAVVDNICVLDGGCIEDGDVEGDTGGCVRRWRITICLVLALSTNNCCRWWGYQLVKKLKLSWLFCFFYSDWIQLNWGNQESFLFTVTDLFDLHRQSELIIHGLTGMKSCSFYYLK